jgi:hypothetical protein
MFKTGTISEAEHKGKLSIPTLLSDHSIRQLVYVSVRAPFERRKYSYT